MRFTRSWEAFTRPDGSVIWRPTLRVLLWEADSLEPRHFLVDKSSLLIAQRQPFHLAGQFRPVGHSIDTQRLQRLAPQDRGQPYQVTRAGFQVAAGKSMPQVVKTKIVDAGPTTRRFETRLRIAFLEKIPRLSDRYFHSRLTSDMTMRAHELRQLRTLPDLGFQVLRER